MTSRNISKNESQLKLRCSLEVKRDRISIMVFDNRAIMLNINEIASIVNRIDALAFSIDNPLPLKETIRRLESTSGLALLKENGEFFGFAAYNLMKIKNKKVIYQIRAIAPGHRNKGLGTYLVRLGHDLFKADYISSKSQNPVSIWSVISSGIFEVVYPIEGDYAKSKEFSDILRGIVENRGHTGKVDLTTGLQKKSCEQGVRSNQRANLLHPGVAMVEGRLIELGLDRNAGDEIYYVGKIKSLY